MRGSFITLETIQYNTIRFKLIMIMSHGLIAVEPVFSEQMLGK